MPSSPGLHRARFRTRPRLRAYHDRRDLPTFPAAVRLDDVPAQWSQRHPAAGDLAGQWHNFGDGNPFETQRDICRRAFDLGFTHFDLANNYGPPLVRCLQKTWPTTTGLS